MLIQDIYISKQGFFIKIISARFKLYMIVLFPFALVILEEKYNLYSSKHPF